MMAVRLFPGVMVIAALTACASPDVGVLEPATSVDATSVASTWDLAGVEAKLRAIHLQPVRAAETVRQSFMSVPGTRLMLGSSEVQIYLYADHVARAHDTAVLNPHHVAPPHTLISWRLPATLIESDNLAAILLTDDPAIRDHVRAALAHAAHPGH